MTKVLTFHILELLPYVLLYRINDVTHIVIYVVVLAKLTKHYKKFGVSG